MPLAGSVIAHGGTIGRLKDWNSWKKYVMPNHDKVEKARWILIAGSSDPPKQGDNESVKANTCIREFLPGISKDLANMEAAILDNKDMQLLNVLRDLKLETTTVLENLKGLFSSCMVDDVKPMVYYTGHGEQGTGNWCFRDGTLDINQIIGCVHGIKNEFASLESDNWKHVIPGCDYPMIVMDSCYR